MSLLARRTDVADRITIGRRDGPLLPANKCVESGADIGIGVCGLPCAPGCPFEFKFLQRNVAGILTKVFVVDVQNHLAVGESSDTDIEWAIRFIRVREYSRTPGSVAKGNRHRDPIN